MKLSLQFLLVSFLFSVTTLVAQVGINTTTPHAQLEIKSSNEATPLNTDGLLIPKVDTFPATNPTVDQQGMLVYLTTASGSNSPGFYYWNNPTTSWLPIAGVVAPGWNLVGNAGTNPATNFLGTTNNQDLVFRRNNVLSGRLSTSNTAFGVSSLEANTGGFFNTAFGVNTLQVNTIGSDNTAIGLRALSNNTTGTANASVGAFTLVSNTTGNFNTAVGFQSNVGANNLTNASAVGARAFVGASNSMVLGSINGVNGATATVNVGIGTTTPLDRLHVVGNIRMVDGNQAAGRVLTSDANGTSTWQNVTASAWGLFGNAGTNPAVNFVGTTDNQDVVFRRNNTLTGRLGETNTSFGNVSFFSNTTGFSNTALGVSALNANTTGSNNTGIGAGALDNNSGGFENTSIGANSLLSNINGSQNTALGFNTLTNNFDGSQNTAIGNRANMGVFNLNNATAIGARASVGASNSIVLGSINGINGATATVNVGIGTTTPLDRLHVVGNIRMVDGNQAVGRVLTSDANGTSTWQNVTASAWGLLGNAGTNPAINFMGTTDNQDVVFRRNNVLSGRLGSTNTAFGVSSLAANTTGFSNTAIGLNTLLANTTGFDNTAIGTSVLTANTTGRSNTAIGTIALRNNTIGNSNTATGFFALHFNTEGSSNTATGENALRNNVTGNGNAGFGLNSLFNNTTGMENAALGIFALDANTTGSQNTAVGFRANVVANNLTNATAIGARARVDASNAMVLGSINGINGATASTNVGIGTTNPLDRLHVNGNIRMVDGNQAAGRVLTSDANGTATWQNASANAWGLLGNAGTNPAINFMGTTDDQDVVFRRNNTLAGRIGSSNTAFGTSTLVSATALGTNNVAIGLGALQFNTEGNQNTAVGSRALNLNTTGSENSALGLFALRSNSTGARNTAIGNRTLELNTTGIRNTAIGTTAISENTTGTDNTAIGNVALTNNTTGSENTVIGGSAMLTNTLGSRNTALGFRANVGIGSLTNATAIGAYSFVNNSNCLILGSINGVNNATASTNVGIGTTNPMGRFELGVDQGRKPGTNTWTIVSDERLKTITGKFTKGLDDIMQLNTINYQYKNNGSRTFDPEVLKTQYVGFSAQEVQKVFPEAVGTDPDGFLNFNMHPILVASVNAFQELKQKNIELEQNTQKLTAENQALKEQVQKQEALVQSIIQRLNALENK